MIQKLALKYQIIILSWGVNQSLKVVAVVPFGEIQRNYFLIFFFQFKYKTIFNLILLYSLIKDTSAQPRLMITNAITKENHIIPVKKFRMQSNQYVKQVADAHQLASKKTIII